MFCSTCCSNLVAPSLHSSSVTLLSLKTRGGLIKPHPDVVPVLQVAERLFRSFLHKIGQKSFGKVFETAVLMQIRDDVFCGPQFTDHLTSLNFIDDEYHRVVLIKYITNHFLNLRKAYEMKNMSEPASNVRHNFKRLVNDKH